MKKRYWFKPKKYGYGVYPIAWEGWLATLILLGVLLFLAHTNGLFQKPEPAPISGILYTVEVVFCGFLFLFLLKGKIDGKLKWRWGNK